MKNHRFNTFGHSFSLILGIVLIASNLRASITAVSPLVGDIVVDTGLSNTLVGLLTTLPLVAFAALSPLAPKLANRFGMGSILLISLILLTGGILIRSIPSVVTLFIGTAMLGLAIAVGNVLLPSLIKREFPNRVGLMTGIYSMSMSIWAAITSGVSVPIAEGLNFGWRKSLLCWAILSIAATVFWFPQSRFYRDTSENISIKGSFLWQSKLAWQVTLFMGLQSIAFYVTTAWLPQILHDTGVNANLAGWMLSLMQFVSLPITFVVPLLAGRLPNQQGLVIVSAFLLLLGYIGLLTGRTNLVVLGIIMIGLSNGANISLALTFFGLRTSNSQEAAELSGMAQSMGYLLAALGPILFGFLHDLTHRWTLSVTVLIIAGFFQLIAGIGAGRNDKVAPVDRGKIAH